MLHLQRTGPAEFMILTTGIVLSIIGFWWFVGFVGFGMFATSRVPRLRRKLGRLTRVAAYLATLVTLPLCAVLLPGLVLQSPFDERMFPPFLAMFIIACRMPAWLRSSSRAWERHQSLPLVTDAELSQRVADIAQQMRVPTPLVRMLPSLSAKQMTSAYVHKLQDPELIVTDGILHRIEKDECAAIIAHELGHIANGSLWLSAAIWPISLSIAAVVAVWLSPWIALPFAIAFSMGFHRITSRPIEHDCDRRAARALGYPVIATALRKLYAVAEIPDSGLIELLWHSILTHPTLDSRIASLNRDLPADQQLSIKSPNRVRIERVVSIAGAVIWALLLGLSLLLSTSRADSWHAQVPLWLIIVVPQILARARRLGRRKAVKRRQNAVVRWLGDRQNRLFQLFVASLVSLVTVSLFMSTWTIRLHGDFEPGPVLVTELLVLTIVTGMIWFFRRANWNTAFIRMLEAAQFGHYGEAVEICEKNIRMVNQSSAWRYSHAFFKAIVGERERAAEMVEQLCLDDPDFGYGWHLLASLALDLNRPERTLEVVDSLRSIFPTSAAAAFAEIRALLRLNRLDEAQRISDSALIEFPGEGTMLGLGALLAACSGSAAEADRLMEIAFEKSPGDTFLLVAKAQIKLRLGTLAEAEQAVNAANQSIAHNPLIFLRHEVEQINNDLKLRSDPSNDPASVAV